MNFNRHEDYKMNSIFDILDPNYKLVIRAGEHGGYYAQALIGNLFKDIANEKSE